MQRNLWILLLGVALTACHDDHTDQPEPVAGKPEPVPALTTGTYAVSVETGQELPTVGKYYSGADGSKLVVLNDEQDRAQRVIHYDAATRTWHSSNQSGQPPKLEFASQEKIADRQLGLNELAGSYSLSLADGRTIPVEIKGQGQINSLDQNCRFSGKISESPMANTATYQFTENSCAALKNNVKGYVVIDEDLEPAAFRLLSDTVNAQDIWAFSS